MGKAFEFQNKPKALSYPRVFSFFLFFCVNTNARYKRA